MKKWSKKKKGVVIAAGVALLGLAGIYGYQVSVYQNHFLPGTRINELDCGKMTAKEAEDAYRKETETYQLTLTFRGDESETIAGKDFDYTYTLGVFETIELLKNRPDLVLRVYIKSNSYKNKGIPIIDEICREKHIELIESDNTIQKLSKKDNCFAIAIIKKYEMTLQEGNHVVLVNPGDMGNMGTIMRTMLGFNYYNLAIIRPGVDVFDPRVLRASMGAMFHLNIEYFDSFEDYLKRFPSHDIYTLMLKGATNIHKVESKEGYHSLVFGNESSGLPDEYLDYGKSIFIPHSHHIDSLNLSMALGMTLMHFSKDEFKDKEVL